MSLPIATLTGANTIAQLIYNVNQIKTFAANTVGIVANSTFQSTLANTNSYIATKTSTTTFNSALANTNTYIATKVNTTTFNSALANTNSYIAMKANTSNPIFNGIIGIGISPTRTLDVNGYVQIGSTGEGRLGIGEKLSTGAAHIELGQGRSGNGHAYIDLVGDTTYTDYGLRILRGDSGANTTSNMWHRGTGDFNFVTQDAAPIIFYTNSTERMRIDSAGNLGIGTTTIDNFGGGHKTLEVSGSSNAHGGVFKTATSDSAGASSAGTEMLMYTTSSGGTIAVTSADPLLFHTSNIERMRIDTSGNIHIGANASYPGKLTIVGINGEVSAGNTTDSLATFSDNGAASISIHSGSASTGTIYFGIPGADGNTKGRLQYNHPSDAMIVYTDNTERMRLDSSGNMSIGTSTSDALLYARRTSGTTAPIGRFEAAIGAFTGTSLTAQNTLGTSNTYNLFTCVTDSDGDSGGPYTLFQVRGDGRVGILGSSINQSALRVNGSISVTSSDTDFGAGGNRAMIDLAGSVARIGAMNGGGGAVELALYSASAERMRLDSSGRLVHGHTTATSFGTDGWGSGIQEYHTQGIAIIRSAADPYGGALNLVSSRGSVGSPTIVTSGDRLGGIYFSGYDGGDFNSYGAAIEAQVDGTPGVNDMPGRLLFYTVADGSNTLSERMRLDSSGNVGIGTSSPTTTLDVAGTARATQGMPIASQSANTKTLALTDNGSYVRCSNSTTMTVTIPNNSTVAFPTGAEMVFFQVGAGNVQFANAAGVTVNSKGDALFLTGQFSAATLKKITTNTWDLIGDLA
jgi:hypothetical protein